MATVEASANGAAVVRQDDVFAIYAAGESSAGNFHLGVLVTPKRVSAMAIPYSMAEVKSAGLGTG
jgi:hypothetical protein